MENKEQENTKAQNTDHPKPSDEVQLTIETVTPDTVRTVPETTVDSEAVEEKTERANDNPEATKVAQPAKGHEAKGSDDANGEVENIDDQEEAQREESVKSENSDSSQQADGQGEDSEGSEGKESSEEGSAEQEPAGGASDETATASGNDKEAGNDERDQIETIAP